MPDGAHDAEREAARQARLPHHQAEAHGAEQKPRGRVREPGERRLEFCDPEHPEQEAAEDTRDAVVEHLRHPGRDHEQADGERLVRLRRDAERHEPERDGAGREDREQAGRAQIGRDRRGRKSGGGPDGRAAHLQWSNH